MQRRATFLVSIAILGAAAAFAAWLVLRDSTGGGSTLPKAPNDVVSESRGPRKTAESLPVTKGAPPPEELPASRSDGIDGIVTDEAGRPVGDATVQIIDLRYDATSTRPIDRRFAEVVLASTVSGDDGRFSFAGLTPNELKVLRASKPGFVTQMKDQVRVPARRDFRLVPGAAVRGRVVSATTGQPIASVGIKGWFPAGSDAVDRRTGFRWTEEVFTNKNGDFSFEGVPAGLVRFMLAHPDYEDLTEELHEIPRSGTNALNFKMKEALLVEGVVLHATKGTPAPDVEVSAAAESPLGLFLPRWKARTGADGRFRMAGVRSGTIAFSISGRGFSPASETRELTAENDFAAGRAGKPLEFKVTPAGRVTGRVTQLDGQGIVGARIFVSPAERLFEAVRDPAQHGGSVKDGEIRTDPNGAFLIDDLAPQHYRLVADAPGFALGVSEPFKVGPDELREGLGITLRQAPVIRGNLTDENHRPVARASVSFQVPQFGLAWFPKGAFDLGQEGKHEVVSDDLGNYKIELPYDGKIVLGIDHPDYVLVEGVEVPVEDEVDVVKDFSLKTAVAISGTVIGSDGRAAPGALVRAWSNAGGNLREAKAGPTGGYSMTRLEGGTYRMHAKWPEKNETSEFLDDVPAGSLAVDFRLSAAAEVVGAVTDTAGRPVREFQVILRPSVPGRESPGSKRKTAIAGMSERQEEVDDEGGRFRITGMDPGAWTLQIAAKGFARSVPIAQVLAAGSTTSAGTIVVRPGGAVSGRVVAPGGGAAAGVSVTLVRVGKLPDQEEPRFPPEPPAPVTTGPTGEYSVKGIAPGEYLLRAESEAFVDPPAERMPIREGDVIERSWRLRAAATVSVAVRDEVGEPVPTAVVTVRDKDQRKITVETDATSGASTNAAGKITLRKVPAGEDLTFHLMRPGFEVVESQQRLKEGDNGSIEIKLPRLLFR